MGMPFPRLLHALLLPLCLGAQGADRLRPFGMAFRRAQKETTSACGKIVETRTSALLARPMVFRGKFCAEGLERFWLDTRNRKRCVSCSIRTI